MYLVFDDETLPLLLEIAAVDSERCLNLRKLNILND